MESITLNPYLLAGCNGASKTTVAYALLPGLLGCREFVNAKDKSLIMTKQAQIKYVREQLRKGLVLASENMLAFKHQAEFRGDCATSRWRRAVAFVGGLFLVGRGPNAYTLGTFLP